MYYLLDSNKQPYQVTNMEEYLDKISGQKRVALTEKNKLRVSTVFLGIDHSFNESKPLLFESMVFPEGSYDEIECRRYYTYEEAIAGHKELIQEYLK